MSDTENALNRFPIAEVNAYVNSGIAALYDILVANSGEYFESQFTFITDGINFDYPLPADFYQLKLAQLNIGNFAGVTGYNVPLRQYNLNERPMLSSSTPGFSGFPFGYRLHGGTVSQAGTTQGTIPTNYCIELLPRPSANINVLLFYVPTCPLLISETDTLDTINGWDLYAVAHASKLVRIKDDLSTTAQDSIMAETKARILGLSQHRNITEPRRITDLRSGYQSGRWRTGGYRRNGW